MLVVAVPASRAVLEWAPVLVFVLVAAVLFRQLRRASVGAAASEPKVEARREQPRVSWADVAGLDEAKSELRELVDFLREPERFARLGAHPPKGILLHGPPGTGKTLLARAVAHEAGVPFYMQSASAFVEMYAGVGAARIRALFAAARKDGPSILFIDELDAVGVARSGDGLHREHDQTLNQLLVELDGFHPDDRVIVLAASNRLDGLDPALLRPGRFDRHVLCSTPDLAGREAILRVHTKGKPLANDVDIAAVARQSAGLTGADLASVANEAAILAGRQELQRIRHVDLEAALERVVVGLPSRRRVSEREKRILAFHEGGHALVAHALGIGPLQKVTIVGRGAALGATIGLPGDDRHLRTRDELIDLLTVTLAGRAAEQVVFGRVTDGAADDLERATSLARAMVFEYGMGDSASSRTMRADNYALSEETKRLRDAAQASLTDGAYTEALRLLVEHRDTLDRLATELLRKETLDRRELAALLTGAGEDRKRPLALGVLRSLPRRD